MAHASSTTWQASVRIVDQALDRLWPAQPLGTATDLARWESAARLAMFLIFAIGFPIAVIRATNPVGNSDYRMFYNASRYLLEHGVRDPNSNFGRYLPSSDVAILPLAMLPMWASISVWYLLGLWSWLALLNAVGRYLLKTCAAATRRQAILATGLLVAPLAVDGLCLGAFHVIMVWLMVAGLGRVAEGQTWRGGMMLGLAIWVKLLPGLGVLYLLVKRQWLAAFVALATFVATDAVLSVVAYGPRAAVDLHVEWWKNEGEGALGRQLGNPAVINEDRLTNQSIPVMLRRVATQFGMSPGSARNAVAWGNLSSQQLRMLYFSIIVPMFLALFWYCRRPSAQTSPEQSAAEIAMLLMGTLWFSPVVWAYFPTAMVPALALVLSYKPTHSRIVWASFFIWLLTLALVTVPLARAVGQLMLASFYYAIVLVILTASARQESPPASAVPA